MHDSAHYQGKRTIPAMSSLMRVGKFLVVGGLGTLVNTGILVILYRHAHLALVASSAVATELAIGHNFLLNNYWTFGRRGVSFDRLVRFNVVSLGGQCITVATLWLLVQCGMYYLIANVAGIGLALIWNFTVNVRWTWGSKW